MTKHRFAAIQMASGPMVAANLEEAARHIGEAARRGADLILNPSANPDGHERFTVWYNSLSVGTDEPYAYEWDEPWGIWGRYGHYRFDMNRDMIALSHAPMRAALATMLRWHPQVVVESGQEGRRHHGASQNVFSF